MSKEWEEGWFSAAITVHSPNFGERPLGVVPELIVIHSISLPPGEFNNGHIKELFLNELDWSLHPYFQTIKGVEVSAHFVINRKGELIQYVSCDKRAWHAGQSSWQGREECNDWSIGIELEGLEGELFEQSQYKTLIILMNKLIKHYPIKWIAGHEHIAPERKHDPGMGFEWQQVIQGMVTLKKDAFPTQVIKTKNL